ncbi:MAG: T9SS type A sorting domain-containing protein [Bacteroidetes bacterium]|nr:T9SS type A sorting domain-containing protein [Bacteroidota bacterium]
MKTAIFIVWLVLPIVVFSQQSSYKSPSSDNTWQNVGNSGFSQEGAYYTSLAFNPADGQPFVAFADIPVGCGTRGPGVVMRFDGSRWVNVGIAGFTIDSIGYTSLAFSPVDNMPYVAFAAGCSGTVQAKVMKYDGSNWVNVGNGSFSPGPAAYTSLAFNPVSGQAYVAFMDVINSNKASVMKFDGANWVYVGSPDFSSGESLDLRIAFSPSGTPFVVYQDFWNTGDVTVMKFDGTDWVNVGSPGFTSGQTDEAGFGISPLDGQPYVAIDDAANYHQIKVMKFDGTNWTSVGDPGSTLGWATRMGVAFSSFGQLYISYWDSSFPGICVKTFDGTNWISVGNAGFSEGYPDYPSFLLSPSDTPYLAYMDEGNSGRATVMKYDFPTGLNEPRESGLSLYPNPVTTNLTIDFRDLDCTGKDIEVCDLQGKIMFAAYSSEYKVILNTAAYPAGLYILKVKTENSSIARKFGKN